MPFSKPILDEVYPDRLWANNLAVVLRWVDSDKLLKMQDGSIYYLDVDHPYIKPFYKKFGLDIIELTSSSLMSALDTVYKGKKIAAFHFAEVKIKIKEESNTDRHLRHMKPIQKAQRNKFTAEALTKNKSGTIKKQGELF